MRNEHHCPDCDTHVAIHQPQFIPVVGRREFLKATGAAAALGMLPSLGVAAGAASTGAPESLVKTLLDALTEEQKTKVCFDWDYVHPQMGLLRTRVANNWHITDPEIRSEFFTSQQQEIIRAIFEGIIHPDWHTRIDQQLEDDAGGYGRDQNVAIFGTPGSGKFEFVMTGRHMTLRCDGDSADHVAFGGPIFYGHAATGFDEGPNHEGNVFWPQALAANKLFDMLDGKQRQIALVSKLPEEHKVAFRGSEGGLPGLPVSEMSSDQREQVQKVLQVLIEPYRQGDRDEAVACLAAQGGLDKCALAFYQEGDIGDDKVWDCWRLEGPAFVWYFRGTPHVHVWVNVANDPSVATNT